MRLGFLLILILVVMPASLLSQGKGAADPYAPKRYGSYLVGAPAPLKKQLNLTSAQDKTLKAINAKYDAKMKATFQSGSARDMEGLRPIFEGRWTDLYAVLTTKQKQTLKKWAMSHPR